MTIQAIAGLSVTQHGDPGGDIAAIANLPVGEDGHALRLVGYMLTDGGYIDNPLRGQNDVNRVHVRGGRGTFRLEAGDGWTIDLGGIRSEEHTSELQSLMRISYAVFCLKKKKKKKIQTIHI